MAAATPTDSGAKLIANINKVVTDANNAQSIALNDRIDALEKGQKCICDDHTQVLTTLSAIQQQLGDMAKLVVGTKRTPAASRSVAAASPDVPAGVKTFVTPYNYHQHMYSTNDEYAARFTHDEVLVKTMDDDPMLLKKKAAGGSAYAKAKCMFVWKYMTTKPIIAHDKTEIDGEVIRKEMDEYNVNVIADAPAAEAPAAEPAGDTAPATPADAPAAAKAAPKPRAPRKAPARAGAKK